MLWHASICCMTRGREGAAKTIFPARKRPSTAVICSPWLANERTCFKLIINSHKNSNLYLYFLNTDTVTVKALY